METSAEIQLVYELANRQGLNFTAVSILKNPKTQEAFRKERLSIFLQLAIQNSCQAICLGHHLDDDVETFVMQLGKGATRHLHGIAWETSLSNGIRIVHPLLNQRKTDVINYCRHHQLLCCNDSSNASSQYLRNRLRKEIP